MSIVYLNSKNGKLSLDNGKFVFKNHNEEAHIVFSHLVTQFVVLYLIIIS